MLIIVYQKFGHSSNVGNSVWHYLRFVDKDYHYGWTLWLATKFLRAAAFISTANHEKPISSSGATAQATLSVQPCHGSGVGFSAYFKLINYFPKALHEVPGMFGIDKATMLMPRHLACIVCLRFEVRPVSAARNATI